MAGRTVLIATDADEVFDEVDAAFADQSTDVARVRAGRDVVDAIRALEPQFVILDLQIGNMGGVATCLEIRNEESGDRLPAQRVLLLLDREADTYLAQQASADGWLLKPLDPISLRRAAAALP
ncbi:MAG: response regulator [Actinomycetes bacterium]